MAATIINVTLLVYGFTTQAFLQGVPNIRPAFELATQEVQRSSAEQVNINVEYVMASDILTCESYSANLDQAFSHFYLRPRSYAPVLIISAGLI